MIQYPALLTRLRSLQSTQGSDLAKLVVELEGALELGDGLDELILRIIAMLEGAPASQARYHKLAQDIRLLLKE
jgi:hypothetical protein